MPSFQEFIPTFTKPTGRSVFSNKKMNKREQIVDVASRLFSERGFENTPLSLVCETANVSKGLIFHHFKSKNELLREIFSQTTQLIVEINNAPQQDHTPQERILELLESFFTQLKSNKLFFQLNLSMMLQPKTREFLNDLIKERSSFILDSVNTIFKEIDPENYAVRSYMFVAELDGVALNYLCIFDEYPLNDIKQQLLKRYARP